MTRKLSVFAGLATALALSCVRPAWGAWQLNMPQGVTISSREIYDLHMIVLGICAVIAIGVYAAMVYAIVKFRKSKGTEAAQFTHNTTAEVVWTVIPALILIVMAVPAAETLVRLEDTRNSELSIKITGSQWQWHYEYLDEGIEFYSRLDRESNMARQPGSNVDPRTIENYLLEVDEPVVVPVDTKVRLLVTAVDVIHAWWVPELGIKKDAIPGFVNEIWFQATETGTFRGQCAELCGMDHGFMPIVVRVASEEAYQDWLTEKQEAAGISRTSQRSTEENTPQ